MRGVANYCTRASCFPVGSSSAVFYRLMPQSHCLRSDDMVLLISLHPAFLNPIGNYIGLLTSKSSEVLRLPNHVTEFVFRHRSLERLYSPIKKFKKLKLKQDEKKRTNNKDKGCPCRIWFFFHPVSVRAF